MKLAELLTSTRGQPSTIEPEARVTEAIALMNDQHIGSVIVVDPQGRLAGIFTERDVMRLCAQGLGARLEQLAVADYMTHNVITGTPDDDIDTTLGLMTERRFRHLPVLREERLVGLLSIGDLVKAKLDATAIEAEALRQYINS